ncbi:MAG: methyltransferase domain-containing protein [Candidatus Portnoybacteria bacterium]|nr:methyltransferase domain-containing protein [Candidatus Portnoybacteria bacterium]MDD4982476.1 methyltransferase domain-containing protein [Candidatus Portnoybacteria bacterium]
MEETLIEIIVCPECGAKFSFENILRENGVIVSGDIKCSSCGKIYPIIKGIPRLLPESDRFDNYSKNFEHYLLRMDWHKAKRNKERFYELTGWEKGDLVGKDILDAGCGNGRWLVQFAEEGAGNIVGFDFTQAIERAVENCREFTGIHFLQSDLFKMPFKDEYFDIVYCHGVLMMTPDPEKAVECLGKKVKPGGEIVLLVYRNLTPFQKFIDNCICGLTKRLPVKVIYYLSLIPTCIEYIPGAVPIFENIFHLSGQPSFMLKHLHNFDWYSSSFRHRISPAQMLSWLEKGGFGNFKVLDTNDFRTRSRWSSVQKIKENLLEKGYFLKATLGVRAVKK